MIRSDWAALAVFVITLAGAVYGRIYSLPAIFWFSLSFGGLLITILAWRGVRTRLLNDIREQIVYWLHLANSDHQNSLAIRERLPENFPPVTGYSMCSMNLAIILDIVDRSKPHHIMELGSGLSTLAMAETLSRTNSGRVISVEHDVKWAELLSFYLNRNGLSEFVDLRTVPLVRRRRDDRDCWWYDEEVLGTIPDPIDLLIVDGPPASFGEEARWPALPHLVNSLSSSAIVLVDDGGRRGETSIVQQWLSQFGDFRAERVTSLTGMWILRRDVPPETYTSKTNRILKKTGTSAR